MTTPSATWSSRGRKGEIAAETERLLADHDAMDLINNHFIPALDEVGVLFDQGKFFLPQLMASAEAARVGFDTIKRMMPAGEIADKGKICVATVKGDIHDIGKNIVKMLLDNYGYTVFDWVATSTRKRCSRPSRSATLSSSASRRL